MTNQIDYKKLQERIYQGLLNQNDIDVRNAENLRRHRRQTEKRYRDRHHKEYLEKKRAWSKAHPEYEAMRKHRYYMEHREEILQRGRERKRRLRAKQKEQYNATEITEQTSQSCVTK